MTRDEKKAQTRQRLLDAAAEVFARRGLDGASLDEIAAEAGLTKGAVYSNFANKEELVLAVLIERTRARTQTTLDNVEIGGDLDVEARRAGDIWVKQEKEDPTLLPLWLEAVIFARRNADFAARLRSTHEAMTDEITETIARTSRESGVPLAMTPDDLALLFNALVNGLAIERLQDPERVPDDFFGRAIALVYDAGVARATDAEAR